MVMSLSPMSVGFIISVISARTLGPEGRGGYSLALLVMGTAGFLANPGVYAAANYFSSKRHLPKSEVFQTTFALTFFSCISALILAISVYYLVMGPHKVVQTADTIAVAFMVGIGAAAQALGSSMSGILIGSGRIRTVAIITLASTLFQGLIALVNYMIAGNHTVLFYVVLFAGAQLFEASGRTVLAGHKSWHRFSFRGRQYRQFLTYGTTVHIGRVLFIGAQKADFYLVFILAGQIALGYYGISAMIADQLWLAPMAVSMVMMANIATLSTADAATLTTKTSQVVMLVTIGAALILMPAGILLIPNVYGAEFLPSVVPFLLMLPGMVAISTYAIIEPFFQSRKRPWIPVQITAGGLAANLLLSLLLIPHFGIRGAAIAYTLSYVTQLLLSCIALARFVGIPLSEPINILSLLRQGGYWFRMRSQAWLERSA